MIPSSFLICAKFLIIIFFAAPLNGHSANSSFPTIPLPSLNTSVHRADSNLDFSQISHGRRACTGFRSPSLPPRSYLPQSWNPSIQRTTILVQDFFYERFIDILFEVYTAAFLIMWFLTAIRSPSRPLPPACSKPRWSLLFARAVDPIKWPRVVSSQWACTWGFYK